MKKQILIFTTITALVISCLQLSGCGGKKEYKEKTYDNNTNLDELKKEQPALEAVLADQSSVKSETTDKSSAEDKIKIQSKVEEQKIPSKIIKTADVSMQVKNIKNSRDEILAIVKNSGAYIATENQATNFNNITNDMTIRIKPEGFDGIVDKLLEQSIYTDYKKISSQDVTADYIDTEARLKSKKDVETRYTEILKKAGTVKDILAVEEELRHVREEIEAAEGKLKYLNDQVGYSTINLHFYEKLDSQVVPDSGFFYKLGKAFKGGWQGLQMFFIAIIYLWPLWLIASAILYFVLWLVKRNKIKKLKKEKS